MTAVPCCCPKKKWPAVNQPQSHTDHRTLYAAVLDNSADQEEQAP